MRWRGAVLLPFTAASAWSPFFCWARSRFIASGRCIRARIVGWAHHGPNPKKHHSLDAALKENGPVKDLAKEPTELGVLLSRVRNIVHSLPESEPTTIHG